MKRPDASKIARPDVAKSALAGPSIADSASLAEPAGDPDHNEEGDMPTPDNAVPFVAGDPLAGPSIADSASLAEPAGQMSIAAAAAWIKETAGTVTVSEGVSEVTE